MIDEAIREAVRKGGILGQEHLKLLARVGNPHPCCFCGHAVLAGQDFCEHRKQYQVGDVVYHEGTAIGRCVEPGRMAFYNIWDSWGTIELPDSWNPPCECDHRHPVPEPTLELYERAHGVDKLVLTKTRVGLLYHVAERNADGSPRRYRPNGKMQVWKTRPKEFRLPIKYGMYGYHQLTDGNCHLFRTEADWARGWTSR